LPWARAAIVISACVYGQVPMHTASTSAAPTTSCHRSATRAMPNSFATRSPEALLRLATVTSSTPGWAASFGMWGLRWFAPAPMNPTRITGWLMAEDYSTGADDSPIVDEDKRMIDIGIQ